MSLRIGDEAPDFVAETTEGTINFHEWVGDGWAILFSHPKDFTPVCTTELGYMAGLTPEFQKRNCKIMGLSVDPVSDHQEWKKDIQEKLIYFIWEVQSQVILPVLLSNFPSLVSRILTMISLFADIGTWS